MTGRSPQRFYSGVPLLLAVAGLVCWLLLGYGQDPAARQYPRLAFLSFATLQFFEGLARYRPGPNLRTLSPAVREGVFAVVALLIAAMALTADTGGDFEHALSVRADAAMVVLFSSLVHFLFAASNETLADRALKRRLVAIVGGAILAGLAAFVAARPGHFIVLEPRDALAVPLLVVVGGLATMPRALRAWQRHVSSADDPFADLRRRVEAVQRGDSDELLLQLRELEVGGPVFDVLDVLGGERRELVAPANVVPVVEEGQWVLVAGARVVTSTRGGSGYRGVEEYERLDRCREALEVGDLPLPEAPPPRLHPAYVEALLALAILAFSGSALFLGSVAYP